MMADDGVTIPTPMIEPGQLSDWGPLLEALPQGVVVADRNGRVVLANQGACRILGIPREDLLGTAFLDRRWRVLGLDGVLLPDLAFPGLDALTRGQSVDRARVELETLDGRTQWLEVSAAPYQDSCMVVTFEDVTERRRAAQALRESELRLRTYIEQSIDEIGRAHV